MLREGFITGVISGGMLAALVGFLVGVGALVVPGLGTVSGVGPFGGVLTTTWVFTVAGSLLGGVIGGVSAWGMRDG